VRDGEDPGRSMDGKSGSAAGRLSRILRGIRRRLPDGRPIQIDEAVAAAVEAVRGRALRGIRRRYLPSSLRIAVSPEDYRFLDPFREELEGEVWRALEDLKGEDDGGLWLATADPVALVLGVEASLDPGAPPRVDLAYPEGVRTASWAAGAAASGKTGGPWPLRLVLTAAAGDGTALQETVEAWLGLELPRTLVEPDAAPGEILQIRGGQVVERSGQPWLHGGRSVEANPPPPTPRGAGSLPVTWDGPWLRLRRGDGSHLVWCPGGVLFVGREPVFAHLVPTAPSSLLSAAHFALWSDDARIVVCDLESTNGTLAGTTPLPPGEPLHLAPPVTLQVGSRASLTIEVHRND